LRRVARQSSAAPSADVANWIAARIDNPKIAIG
jgi:hypothetical protein